MFRTMVDRWIQNFAWIVVCSGVCFPPAPVAAQTDEFEREPIRYSQATPDNAITKLQAALDRGDVSLARDERLGYLPALLKALDIADSSQMLVFSKTSLQRHRIAPATPRALYFNDNVYLGYCQEGDVLEVSAVDPQLGTVFYTFEQTPSAAPKFMRQGDSCLLCHSSSQTDSVPGHLVRSVFPDTSGMPILSSGTYRIDHTSPLTKRWGGWYVTGTHGDQTHLGNLIIRERRVPEPLDNSAGQNVTSLREFVRTANYLTPHSDIVALMVLEHQAMAHNLLTRANFLTRQALHHEEILNRELKEAPGHRWDSTNSRIRNAGDPLVDYLLFVEEAPLTATVRGTSAFAADFAKQGPRDDQGRSVRAFDLEHRLFKYPCSYLIYSPSFDALPDEVRDYVLDRLWRVLTERDASAKYAHLSHDDRTAVLEILRATKPSLPDYWRKS